MNRPKLNCHLILASAVACMTLWLCFAAGSCYAQEANSGTTSRKVREQAQKAVPYDQLNQEAIKKIRNIVTKPSMFRRLPHATISVDHDYYLHLLRHPEVIINIWELMGVTEMTAARIGPYTLDTNDGAGTTGNVELIYGTNNMQIFYGEGEYQGNMLPKKLRGKCVIIVQTHYHLDEQGMPATTSQLDIFMKLENVTLNLIAKTLSPLIGPTADHNFVETVNFIQRLNETTVKNGPGVQAMAHRLTNLTPEVRKQFVQTAGLVYDRSKAAQPQGNFSTQVGIQQERVKNRYSTSSAPMSSTQAAYATNPYQTTEQVRKASHAQQPANYPAQQSYPSQYHQPSQSLSPSYPQSQSYPQSRQVPVRQFYGNGNPTRQSLPAQPTQQQPRVYSMRQPSFAPNRYAN